MSATTASKPINLEWNKTLPERIVFCIDLCNEVNAQNFSKSKKGLTRFTLMKEAICLFLDNKARLSEQHQYALCALTDAAIWYQDFTSDVELVKSKLMKLEAQGQFLSFDLLSLLNVLNEHAPEILGASHPKFVYRAILIYSRSTVIPELRSTDLLQSMIKTQKFFLDILYLHHKPAKDNRVQEVYDALTGIEPSDQYWGVYMFEHSSNKHRVFTSFTMLLAHPQQRPEQQNFVLIPWDKKK